VDGWHIQEVCKHLEALVKLEFRNLIINIPPGCMKSLLVNVFFPCWAWAEVDPALKWLFASFDDSLVLRDARRAKDIITSSWYTQLWGDKVQLVKDRTRADSASEYYTTAGGMRFSTTVAGKATGWHSDIQIVDDPIKPRDTKGGSEATGVKLEEAREWWQSTMSTRKANPSTFRRVVVMQRVHENDLTGVCTAPGSEESYVHLRLPMEYEADNPCTTPVGGDKRTEEGELLWPQRFTAKEVEGLKNPHTGLGEWDYAAQCQQRPLPKKGGTFAKTVWKRWTVLPDNLQWLISADMRFKEDATSGDFVVIQVWAWEGARFFLVDQFRGKWSFTQTLAAMRLAVASYPQATLRLVENKANGPAIVNMLEAEVAGMVLVEPYGDKVARANAVSPFLEAGNVYLPEDQGEHPWIADFLLEVSKFPRYKFDDQVDAMTQALQRMSEGVDLDMFEAMRLAREKGIL
jgi:predicted phage terminase large subunit-like protein